MKNLSVYIHIPFCKRKCLYCDFPSFANCENEFDSYVNSLREEMLLEYSNYRDYEITSVFIGGGTPTSLPCKLIGKIMDTLFSKFNISPSAEITIEANPGTIDSTSLTELRSMDINRISMGLQAWQNTLLEKIGRIHDVETFIKNFSQALNSGFKNINIDLMFSLPSQTLKDWEETLENVIKLKPAHISCYSLIIEEDTPFKLMFDKGIFKIPDEILDREMYYLAKEMLKDAGYKQYEISNFCLEDMECSHNIVYWEDREYIGFGLGAHSFFRGERFHNTLDMKKYIKAKGNIKIIRENIECIDIKAQYAEFMFMGLRLIDGVSDERFFNRFGKHIKDIYSQELDKLMYENLITINNDIISLTEKGIDLSNYVFTSFL